MQLETSRCRVSSAVAAVFLSLGVAAQEAEPIQQIDGAVNGEVSSWRLATELSAPSAVYSVVLPGVYRIRIVGYQDEKLARKGSVQLEFVLRDGAVERLDARYFPFDPLHPRFSAGVDHGNGELRIDTFEPEINSARLRAQYRGELFYHQSANTRPIPHRTTQLELDLAIELVRN